jgi:putative endonuclease
MAWTYIVECADGTFYCGSTIDLDRRISQHNLGEGATYTRIGRRRPVKLKWAAEFDRIDEAFAYEKRIRKWSRAKRIALIEDRLEDLPALARGHSRRPLPEPDADEAVEG